MPPVNSLISWSNLAKGFGRRPLFSGISGELAAGRVLVVTGANGAGKSTFLKIILGLLAADVGECKRLPIEKVGYCAHSMELYGDLTGMENLEFFARVAGVDESECRRLLDEVGLGRAGSKLYSSYSSGMKQRLKLAFALLNSPDLLVLDEPTLALDSDGTAIVDSLIARQRSSGGSALIATNEETEATRWADDRLPIGKQAW